MLVSHAHILLLALDVKLGTLQALRAFRQNYNQVTRNEHILDDFLALKKIDFASTQNVRIFRYALQSA